MKTLDSKDVLVIDADETIRGGLAAALVRLAVTFDTAIDDADALSRLAGTRYAVILVDLMAAGTDGEAFVRALRQRERTSRERPVVLITATPALRDRLPELGDEIQAVIRKPFDVGDVADLVRGCIEGRNAYEERRRLSGRKNDAGIADARPGR